MLNSNAFAGYYTLTAKRDGKWLIVESPDEKLKSLDHVKVKSKTNVEIVQIFKSGKFIRFESDIQEGIIKMDTFK